MAGTMKVLYVDDEPGLLELAMLFLEKMGEFQVETATSAQEALTNPVIQTYDAIISDYQMPDMDGIAFLKAVRERFGDIPFILFTGKGREEVVIEAINNGVDFYIQKGGDPKAQFVELAHKIRQAVKRRQAEEKMKLLSISVDQAYDEVFWLDFEGNILYVNEAACRTTGYFREELQSMKIFMLDPDFPPEVWARSVADLRQQKNLFITTRHRCKNGTIIDVEIMTSYVQKGDIEYSFAFVRDISDRKRAEETIAKSTEYLNQIFSSLQAGIVIIDVKNQEIVDINPAGADMIGLPKEQIIGNICHKFICPAEPCQCPVRDLPQSVDNTERILLTHDGNKIPIITSVTLINLDGQECFLETFIDNSEHRRAEDAMRESEEKYHELADLLPQIVFETDPELWITYANRHMLTLFGLTNKDIDEKINMLSFIDPTQHAEVWDSVQKNMNGTAFEPKEYTALRKDGSTFPIIIYSSPIYRNEICAGFRGVAVDISPWKKIENELRESEEKFRSIFENSPYPIAINSLPENSFLEVNKAFLSTSGYIEAEVLGKDPMEMGLLTLTEALKLISHRLVSGKLENVPLVLTAKEGRRVHVLFSTMPVTINDKPAIVTVTAEVTKLKRVEEELFKKNEDLNAAYEELTATNEELKLNYDLLTHKEQTLRESSEIFQAVVEQSNEGIIIVDFSGGLLYANCRAAEIVDSSEDLDTTGRINLLDFVCPDSRQKVVDMLVEVSRGQERSLVNYKITTLLKKEKWIECIGRGISFKNSPAILLSLRDATNRMRAERELRNSEQKFVTVFKRNPVLLTLVSAIDGIFADVNDAFVQGTGYARMEVIGKTATEIGIFADDTEYARLVSVLQEKHFVKGMELRCRIKSGEIRICRFTSSLVFIDGRPQILSTIEDITERKQADDAIRESEELYRLILKNTNEGILVNEQTPKGPGKFIDVNKSACHILGLTREELQDLSLVDLDTPDMKKRAPEIIHEILSNNHFIFQTNYLTKDNREKIIDISVSLFDHNGSPTMLSVIRDITEQKTTESALHALVSSMVGITGRESLDRITESIGVWLRADCIMIGEITPDHEHVRVLSMILDNKKILDYSYTLKGTPCENTVEKGFCIYPDDVARLFPDSRYLCEFHIRGYAGTSLRNSEGQVVGILCIMTRNPLNLPISLQEIIDIIAAKAAAEIGHLHALMALSESEEKFRALVEHSLDGTLILDPMGTILFANNAAGEMIDVEDLEEIIGARNVMEFIAPASRNDVLQDFGRVATGVDGYIARYKILTMKQEELWVESIGKMIIFNKVPSILISLRNITDRQRAEEALQQANKKLNLLSGVTRHDINNQLSILNVCVELLHKKHPVPSTETYFSHITEVTNQITNMIRFTQEYEQIGVYTPVWQDLQTLVNNAGNSTMLAQVSFKNNIPTNTKIFADPLIVKVFFNLIDNALRHGGKISTIQFSYTIRNKDFIIVCEDDGEGVAAEEKEKIFKRDFGKNTGFGLYISREILDITGITIEERGEPGKGARFEITVPEGQHRVTVEEPIVTDNEDPITW